MPIEQIGFGEPVLRDEADVFGNIGVRWTRPLAVDDTVVVVRMPDVGWLHLIVNIIGHRAQMLEIKAAKLSPNSFRCRAETHPRFNSKKRRNEETKENFDRQIRLAPVRRTRDSASGATRFARQEGGELQKQAAFDHVLFVFAVLRLPVRRP